MRLRENMDLYKCGARISFLKTVSPSNFGVRTSMAPIHLPRRKKPMTGHNSWQNMESTGYGFINSLGMLPMAYAPLGLLRINGSFSIISATAFGKKEFIMAGLLYTDTVSDQQIAPGFWLTTR